MSVVMPNYERCNLNIITSILKYYGVESKHASLPELDEKLNSKKYKNVILLVMDGMGEHILNNISPNGFLNNNKNVVLTCVYPSTTTASLTTYYSGKPPYESGWIAWSQYFREYGRAADMLPQKESYKGETFKGVKMDVFKEVVGYKSVFDQIEEASPETDVFELMPEYSVRHATNSLRTNNIDEILNNLKFIMKLSSNTFSMAYSDNPDGLLHKFGTDSEEAKAYLLDAEKKIEGFANELADDTILIISADHGHKNIEKAYTFLDYPEILECLITPPALESRFVSFWVKEEMRETFVNRFNSHFKDEYWLMTREELLEKNIIGFGDKHYKVDDFLGNYVAICTSSSIFRLETFLAEGKPIKKSTHCGMTKEEMEIPLIIVEK